MQISEVQTFMYSLKSKETQKQYSILINYFEKYLGNNKRIGSLLDLDYKTIEKTLIDYIVSMRELGLSYGSIKSRLSPIIAFLELNDVSVNKKKIRKFYPENIKTVKDEAYSREDIQKMLQYASFRLRVIILIYSSTGIRKGALVDLRLKHLQKVENENNGAGANLYKFTIYENTKDEYFTYCTPECSDAIDQYIEKRKTDGEKITPESYLIRNDYDSNMGGAGSSYSIRNPKPINIGNLTVLMPTLLARINFRTRVPMTEDSTYKYQRTNKATYHAFRKYFNTCLANCDVNKTIKEMLMGHSVGLDDVYYKPDEKQLLAEYSKAINELTVNEENRLKIKVEKLEMDKGTIASLVKKMAVLEKHYYLNNKPEVRVSALVDE